MANQKLELSIGQDFFEIYRENGDVLDPTPICYWHQDEWEEDPSIVPSMLNALHLYHTNQVELLQKIGLDYLIL